MKIVSLQHHTGGGKADRWAVNGVRVARHVFENLRYLASHKDCFHTVGRGGGRFTHYTSAHVADYLAKGY